MSDQKPAAPEPTKLDTSLAVPQQAHGGDNSATAPHTEGERGNGAQRRQRKKK